MICKKCESRIVMPAFDDTNCEYCQRHITTAHIPGDKVCKGCAEAHGVCESCGKPIEDDNSKDSMEVAE